MLHVATFKAEEIDKVVNDINASGYGLTFGLHTRIDARVKEISAKIKAGNIYVNRNQIGAVVGSQPFGGEGLSGTGPKAGGPHYLPRFSRAGAPTDAVSAVNALSGVTIGIVAAAAEKMNAAFAATRPVARGTVLPGPTGESNVLTLYPRGVVLCLGPDEPSAYAQARMALAHGNGALVIAPGAQKIAEELGRDGAIIGGMDRRLAPAAIEAGLGVDAIAVFGDDLALKPWRLAMSRREGPIIPLITSVGEGGRLVIERHVCIDTTASGGNAELLAKASGT